MELFRKGFHRFPLDFRFCPRTFSWLPHACTLSGALRSALCTHPRLCMERVLRVLRLKHVPIFQQLCIEEALFYKTTSNW